MKRTGMNNIKDILRRRHDLGLPRAQIAAAIGVSAGTVSHVLERASAAGLSWPLPDDLDDEALRARLYPTPARDSGHAQPDWDSVIEDLKAPRKRRRARLTRRQLWKEYRDEVLAQAGMAYSYSQFCARLKVRLKDRAGQAQMHFDYEPGLYGLADFSGKTLPLRIGREGSLSSRSSRSQASHGPAACRVRPAEPARTTARIGRQVSLRSLSRTAARDGLSPLAPAPAGPSKSIQGQPAKSRGWGAAAWSGWRFAATMPPVTSRKR